MGLVYVDWRKPQQDLKPRPFGHFSCWASITAWLAEPLWGGRPLAQYHAAISDRCHELLHRIIRRTIQSTIREGCVVPVESRHRLEASASRCCKRQGRSDRRRSRQPLSDMCQSRGMSRRVSAMQYICNCLLKVAWEPGAYVILDLGSVIKIW
jgi:hypothetical protein